jgi:hypothetical protein
MLTGKLLGYNKRSIDLISFFANRGICLNNASHLDHLRISTHKLRRLVILGLRSSSRTLIRGVEAVSKKLSRLTRKVSLPRRVLISSKRSPLLFLGAQLQNIIKSQHPCRRQSLRVSLRESPLWIAPNIRAFKVPSNQ